MLLPPHLALASMQQHCAADQAAVQRVSYASQSAGIHSSSSQWQQAWRLRGRLRTAAAQSTGGGCRRRVPAQQ
jgi:hypothetical protein